ncbi:MAG: cyclodeaminase/cyclohydrolase family protein, partial [Firmicutes bacterium]|nr:cyclodeaminase/cyclohydrolase family protein [Bacillota bacterium]
DEMVKLAQDAEDIRQQLMSLMEEDTKAFQQVMSAFRLPKETEDEKKQRQDKIQEAMIYAAKIPLKTAQTALKVLELAQIAAEKGNPNAISDAGVAALLAWAGVEGAALNVKINLGSIKNEKIQQQLEAAIDAVTSTAKELRDKIVLEVKAKLD